MAPPTRFFIDIYTNLLMFGVVGGLILFCGGCWFLPDLLRTLPERSERLLDLAIVSVQDSYMAIGMGYLRFKAWLASLFERLLNWARSQAPELSDKLEGYRQQVRGRYDALRYQAEESYIQADASVRERYPRTVQVVTWIGSTLAYYAGKLCTFCGERVVPVVSSRVTRQYKELVDSGGLLIDEVNSKVMAKISGETPKPPKTPATGARITAEERATWAEMQRFAYEVEMAKEEQERLEAEHAAEQAAASAALAPPPTPADAAAAGPAAAPAAAPGPAAAPPPPKADLEA